MFMHATAKGFTVREIPIMLYDRSKGASKMSFRITQEAAYMVWKFKFLKLLGKLGEGKS